MEWSARTFGAAAKQSVSALVVSSALWRDGW